MRASYSSGITRHISKLEKLSSKICVDSVSSLYNPVTFDECRIFELTDISNEKVIDYIHETSIKLFFVIKGFITFTDGNVLSAGEVRVIPVGVQHGLTVSQGGKAVIILYPPDFDYEKRQTCEQHKQHM